MALLFSLLLKSTIILAVAASATWLLRRRPAALSHTVWMAAFLALALLPAAGSWVPAITAPVRFTAAAQASTAAAASVLPSPNVAFWLWLSGALAFALRLGLGHYRMSRIVANSIETERRDGLSIRETTEACLPLTTGLIAPIVLLPSAARRWPESLRENVISHELAHIRRGDTWSLLFTQLLCCAYWFQPLAWLAAKRAARDREHACDDLVITAGSPPADYASHLVDLARTTLDAPWPVAAVVRRSDLELRVRAVLDPQRDRRRAGRASWSLALTGALALLLPIAALRAQDRIYKMDEGVAAPKLIRKVEPKYTQEAKDAKVEGAVVISVVINTSGQVSQAEVERSLEPGLDANAIDAVRQWVFEPGRLKGEPVSVRATIEVNFRLL
jgi:TonB family protein